MLPESAGRRLQFFAVWIGPKPANNLFIFFVTFFFQKRLSKQKDKNSRKRYSAGGQRREYSDHGKNQSDC